MFRVVPGLVALALIAADCASVFAATNSAERSGFKFDIRKEGQLSSKGASLLPVKSQANRPQAMTNDVLRQYPDEAIFLDVAGVDRLKWKVLRDEIEDAVNNFPVNPSMDREAIENARKIVFQVKLSKILKKYIRYSVVAVEARRLGLKIAPEEFEEERRKSSIYFNEHGAKGQDALARMKSEESYYEHNLTNGLLCRAYSDKVIRPGIVVSEDEVSARLKAQHEKNLSIIATNSCKRALMDEIHEKLLNHMDFAEAAEKWSECSSSDEGGVLTDENDQPQHIMPGDVRIEIEEACKKMKPGEISGVIETPYSWNIVKLLARNDATDDEEASIELAHIMLEKVPLIPELTRDQARELVMNAKVKIAMSEKFMELLKTTKIDCLVPLADNSQKSSRGKKHFIKK